MGISQELWDTFRKLAALEARTEDVVKSLERLEGKVDSLLDRLSRVEMQHQALRESVGNEILADIKAEVAVVKFALGRVAQDGASGQGLGAAATALLSPPDRGPA
jgi:regulator of replication initiation timing